jgi:hypothetical protein
MMLKETQKSGIAIYLRNAGWRIAEVLGDLEWWADEMWKIESTWTPVGQAGFITFLVDPQADIYTPPTSKNVWAAMVSKERPGDRLDRNSFTFSLGSGWEKRLSEITNYLDELRKQD